jgi:hypothetical protein
MNSKKYPLEEKDSARALKVSIIELLLRGESVIIPDFGYLEVKSLPGRSTVLFRVAGSEAQDFGQPSDIYSYISVPLKSGKVVSLLPEVGVFRPVKTGSDDFKISFLPSSSLRNRLNGKEEEVESVVESGIRESTVVEIEPESETKPKITIGETTSLNTKNKAPAGTKTAQVGDVIVPQDDEARVLSKRKVINISGWALVIGAFVAVFVIILTHFSSQNKGLLEQQDATVVQQEARNLPALAEEHYGNSAFWVYIYDANRDKLVSPMNIPDKIAINIPDLAEEYEVDITDSLEIKRANSLAISILKQIRK